MLLKRAISSRRRHMSQGEYTLPESIPGLDIPSALGRLRGNHKLYGKLLVQMREELPRLHEKISEALSTGNFQDIALHAHTLKGMAGNLGATDLQNAASQLEAAVKQQSDISVIFVQMDNYEKINEALFIALAGLTPPQ